MNEILLGIAQRAVAWLAARCGLVALPATDVEAARAKLGLLAQYAQTSGALNHPRRVRARQRVFTFAMATLANLKGVSD